MEVDGDKSMQIVAEYKAGAYKQSIVPPVAARMAFVSCPGGGGTMRILAAIHSPDIARKILECLGLPSRSPPIAKAVPESVDQLEFQSLAIRQVRIRVSLKPPARPDIFPIAAVERAPKPILSISRSPDRFSALPQWTYRPLFRDLFPMRVLKDTPDWAALPQTCRRLFADCCY